MLSNNISSLVKLLKFIYNLPLDKPFELILNDIVLPFLASSRTFIFCSFTLISFLLKPVKVVSSASIKYFTPATNLQLIVSFVFK